MKKLVITLLLICFALLAFAQENKSNQTDFNAYLTIQRGTEFNTAIKIIETLSYQYEAKKIVNSSSFNGNIAIPISQLHWKEALMLLCQTHNLNLEEKGGAYFIIDPPKNDKPEEKGIKPSDKQVKISAIFFRADKTLLNTFGINWQSIVNGKVVADINFQGAGKVADDLFKAKGSYSFEQNGYVIDLNALLKVIESNQKGSVIARPSISVLSGKEGFIQVGQDFSVKTTDESGNISDKFFSTGIILKVVPTVVEYEGQNVIHLTANVEKSSATPGQISTIINKNSANTEVFLYDGEETVIGGLNDIDYTKSKSGIPVLKDLPWWFFGLKYLASYSKFEQTNREMIVILKAEIYDPIEKRLKDKQELKEKIEKLRTENEQIHMLDETKPANKQD
jgi:type IV pilus assembly protein PilQ